MFHGAASFGLGQISSRIILLFNNNIFLSFLYSRYLIVSIRCSLDLKTIGDEVWGIWELRFPFGRNENLQIEWERWWFRLVTRILSGGNNYSNMEPESNFRTWQGKKQRSDLTNGKSDSGPIVRRGYTMQLLKDYQN